MYVFYYMLKKLLEDRFSICTMLKNIDSIDSNDALNDNSIYNCVIARSYVMTINRMRLEYYVAHPTKGDTVREAIQLA